MIEGNNNCEGGQLKITSTVLNYIPKSVLDNTIQTNTLFSTTCYFTEHYLILNKALKTSLYRNEVFFLLRTD